MFPYIAGYIVIFFLSLITVFEPRYTKYYKWIIIGLLVCFAASRADDVDRDYRIYLDTINKLLHKMNYTDFKTYVLYEPVYFLFPYISVNLFHSFLPFFFIMALLGVSLKIEGASYLSNSFFLTIILYVTSLFLLHEMTQIRVGVATGILCLSLKSVYERKLAKFLLFILVACFFHYSSLLFAVVYFLNPHTFNKTLFMSAIIVSCVLGVIQFNIFGPGLLSIFSSTKVEVYNKFAKRDAQNWNIWNFGFLINLALTLLLAFYADIIQQYNKYAYLMVKIAVLSIMSYLLFSGIPILALRSSELYGIVQIFLYPSIIYIFRNKLIGYAILISISMFNFYIYFYYSKIISPYHTWWGQ